MPNYEFDPIKKVLHRQKWLPIWIRVIRWDRIWPQSLKTKFWFVLVPFIGVYGLAPRRDRIHARLFDTWLANGDPVRKAELARKYHPLMRDENPAVRPSI